MTRKQLRGLGLSGPEIDYRIRVGRLIAVFKGVYAVGHVPTNPFDRAHGALLACGDRSALSDGSAETVYGICKEWRYPLEVTCAVDRRPSGLIVHRRTTLKQSDILIHDTSGLRVTSPAITILDIAPRLSDYSLQRAINELRLGPTRMTLAELYAVLEHFPRHPGAKRLHRVVGRLQREPTRSGLEDRWPPFAEKHELTGWEMNVHVLGYRVDVLFGPDRLVVELDAPITHDTAFAIARDKEQDATILEEAGIPTVRMTDEQFKRHPAKQAARIHRILAARHDSRAA